MSNSNKISVLSGLTGLPTRVAGLVRHIISCINRYTRRVAGLKHTTRSRPVSRYRRVTSTRYPAGRVSSRNGNYHYPLSILPPLIGIISFQVHLHYFESFTFFYSFSFFNTRGHFCLSNFCRHYSSLISSSLNILQCPKHSSLCTTSMPMQS